MENSGNQRGQNDSGINLSNMFDISKLGGLLGFGSNSGNRAGNNPLSSITNMFKNGFGGMGNNKNRYNQKYKPRNNVKVMQIEEAYKRIKMGSIFLLDVRTEMEYKCIRIKGSVNVPLDKLQEEIGRYISNKSEEILIYCATGSRVRRALQILWGLGYNNLCIWEGAGINTFAFQDLIVYSNKNEDSQKSNTGGISYSDRSQ